MAGKYRSDRFIKYGNPLPIGIIKLPIIKHWYNPIELIKFGYQFLRQLISVKFGKFKIPVEYDLSGKIFKIYGLNNMSIIWNNGFFGKGNLSRSEPTWFGRTIRRLGIVDEDAGELSNEEVVKLRRLERDYFKLQRKKLDLLEVEYKANNDVVKLKELESKRVELTKSRRNMTNFNLYDNKDDLNSNSLRIEDEEILIDNMKSIELLEYLQLIPQEVIFLKLINSITLDSSILKLFLNQVYESNDNNDIDNSIKPDNKFLIEFFVYYYYKSLNWCIKSGLKFSSNFIIYERGPVFQHAEFALTIIPIVNGKETKNLDWINISSVNRVLSTVKKTMVLTYVKVPKIDEFNEKFQKLLDFKDVDDNDSKSFELIFELLKLYDLDQMILRRWSPSKTRD